MRVHHLIIAFVITALFAPVAPAAEKDKLCGDKARIREILLDAREALAELRGMSATHTDYVTRRQMTRKADQIRRQLKRLRQELSLAEAQDETPPPPAVEAGPEAMPKKRFAALLNAIDSESFGKGKLAVLKDAAQHHHFKVGQVLKAMRRFSFSDGKVKAAATMHPRLVDPENFFEVYKELTFEADKKKLRKLLGKK